MTTVVTFTGPREVGLTDHEDVPLGAGDVRVRTLYSGISAGTELTAYRGSNPYLAKRWDPDRRLFLSGEQTSLEYPVEGWGYEEAGRVVEVGPDVGSVREGDVIYGTWGHRTSAVLSET